MRQHHSRLGVISGAVLFSLIMWASVWFMLATERTITASIPIPTGLHYWLVMDLSYRRLDDGTHEVIDLQALRELRIRAGTEDTVTDTYRPLVDVNLPIWPIPLGSAE